MTNNAEASDTLDDADRRSLSLLLAQAERDFSGETCRELQEFFFEAQGSGSLHAMSGMAVVKWIAVAFEMGRNYEIAKTVAEDAWGQR